MHFKEKTFLFYLEVDREEDILEDNEISPDEKVEESDAKENENADNLDEEEVPLEEAEQEDDNENIVEAKDFMYFRRQCKFETFVSQLKTDKTKSSALGSFMNGQIYEEDKIDDEVINQEVIGFDTRF
jgi:hypothetical protein